MLCIHTGVETKACITISHIIINGLHLFWVFFKRKKWYHKPVAGFYIRSVVLYPFLIVRNVFSTNRLQTNRWFSAAGKFPKPLVKLHRCWLWDWDSAGELLTCWTSGEKEKIFFNTGNIYHVLLSVQCRVLCFRSAAMVLPLLLSCEVNEEPLHPPPRTDLFHKGWPSPLKWCRGKPSALSKSCCLRIVH